MHLVKDTDAHFDDLVRKVGDLSVVDGQTAGGTVGADGLLQPKIEGGKVSPRSILSSNSSDGTATNMFSLAAVTPVTAVNKDLVMDVTRALNEKLENTAVEALLNSKGWCFLS